MSDQHKVGFNPDQKEMWEKLKNQGLTSKPFPTFVKDAFYDAIDNLNIEKITQAQIQKATREAMN